MGVTGPADCGLVYLLRDDDDWTAESGRSEENPADRGVSGAGDTTD